MKTQLVGVASIALIATSCGSPTAPEKTIAVSVEGASPNATNRMVHLDVRLQTTSRGISFVCGGGVGIDLVREGGAQQDEKISQDVECAAASGITFDVPPHSEKLVSYDLPVFSQLLRDGTYKLRIPLFIEGFNVSRIVESDDFSLKVD